MVENMDRCNGGYMVIEVNCNGERKVATLTDDDVELRG